MEGKGAWRSNVLVELLWRSIKYEEVYLHAYKTVSEARVGIGLYLTFYNSRRPHSSLDRQTPDQAYFNALAAQETPATAPSNPQAQQRQRASQLAQALRAEQRLLLLTSPANCPDRIARLLQDRAREFAVAETMDNGKPIKETRDFDVPMAAAHFFYHAGWADKLDYVAPGRRLAPLGVIGQVIPWNFPLLMLAWKIAPALAAGNTVVLKPAEFTSLTALLFAEICEKAKLPKGVVNIVTGEGDTGGAHTHQDAATLQVEVF